MAIKVSGTTVINDSRALENITDIPNIIKSSFIESPANGSTDSGVGKFITIDVSPFQAVFGVAETLTIQLDNNSDFSSPFYNVETTTSGSQVTIDTSSYSFPTSTLVYARARYKDADGNYSDWTPTVSFTTRASFDFVNTPTVTTSGAIDVAPTFTSSAFSTSGGSWTHTSSTWQIATDADFTNIAQQVVESTSDLTSWTLSSNLNYETTYYVRVKHHQATIGESEFSDGVTVQTGSAPGEQVYTTPGTYAWSSPSTMLVSAVAVGGGGGGVTAVHDNCGAAAGACSWINNYSVSEGQAYTVVVGAGGGTGGGNGGDSSFSSPTVCKAGGGNGAPGSGNDANSSPLYNTDRVGDGGGDGGWLNNGSRSGAGGAGGYTGQGGLGQETDVNPTTQPAGGGGGAGFNINNFGAAAGGGVGIFGEGASGTNGTSTSISGKGGSGGADGFPSASGRHTQRPDGGAYGGGAGSAGTSGYGPVPPQGGVGGGGAVRIMWGGGRSFPNNANAV